MLYLNEEHIRTLGIDWTGLIDSIESTVRILDKGDFAQPIKPYLRYNNPRNRIIAMPAYVGGDVQAAGMKWIASFPGNIQTGLPRAHSIILLNHPDTGKPEAVLNSPLPSIIRTASVSGLMIRRYLRTRSMQRDLNIGIIGWGPIGKHHYQMCTSLLGEQIKRIRLYDLKGINFDRIDMKFRDRTEAANCWQEVYAESDIFITCTVSDFRYIDLKPPNGSLLLHVSLRDYCSGALDSIRAVIVDDWDEVCRENTDIELLHRERGLTRNQTRSLTDVICRDAFSEFSPEEPILFCPMGMGVFDIAVAVHYVRLARELGIGTKLD